MKFIICGKEEAAAYVPRAPTLAIRIFGSESSGMGKRCYKPLQHGYVRVLEYAFDDVDLHEGQTLEEWAQGAGADPTKLVPFDEGMAAKILDDFAQCRGSFEDVLVHCYAGMSRSPAVAIALDVIYNLKADFNRNEFPRINWHVCKIMARAAEKKGLLP
ncbi:MAG: hypothetical protein QW548_03600 [Candidatus Aenigmatarchaeota archaeon]